MFFIFVQHKNTIFLLQTISERRHVEYEPEYGFANLAMLKLSAWHKSQDNAV